ncbi:hypothetical protein ACFX2I_008317 [Malus domestica]
MFSRGFLWWKRKGFFSLLVVSALALSLSQFHPDDSQEVNNRVRQDRGREREEEKKGKGRAEPEPLVVRRGWRTWC